MGCRSVTRGFRSIISTWLCRVSRTVCRVIPAGRGVTVVKTVRLDIVGWVRWVMGGSMGVVGVELARGGW